MKAFAPSTPIKGSPMKRYFFDVMKDDRSELDYMGRLFSTAADAYEAAELMALDLVVKHEDEMIGSAVTVSSAEGVKLYSIPVQASYLTAAPSAL
jgi:hypothetical protein